MRTSKSVWLLSNINSLNRNKGVANCHALFYLEYDMGLAAFNRMRREAQEKAEKEKQEAEKQPEPKPKTTKPKPEPKTE